MTIEREFCVDMSSEALTELLAPVLHRVEIHGLSSKLEDQLSNAQLSQWAYTLDARRYVTNQLIMPYFFEKAKVPLQHKWGIFADSVTPQEFIEATRLRKEAQEVACNGAREHWEKVSDYLSKHDAYMIGANIPVQVRTVKDEYEEAGRQLYRALAVLFPRGEVPFELHYAMTAMGINDSLSRVYALAQSLKPEVIEELAKGTTKEDVLEICNSIFSPVGFFGSDNLEEKADMANKSVLFGKYVRQIINQGGKISPADFPYKKPHFRNEEGNLPESVGNLDQLLNWYSHKMYDVAQQT